MKVGSVLCDYDNNKGSIDFQAFAAAAKADDVSGAHWGLTTGLGHIDSAWLPNVGSQSDKDRKRFISAQRIRQEAYREFFPKGWPQAPYHWWTGRDEDGDGDLDGRGYEEADFFMESAEEIGWKPHKGGLVPMLDAEESFLPARETLRGIEQFCKAIRREWSSKTSKWEMNIITYAGSWWRDMLGNPSDTWLREHPLMLPVYGGPYERHVPSAWRPKPGPAIHQFTSKGSLKGFRGHTDLSRVILPKAILA